MWRNYFCWRVIFSIFIHLCILFEKLINVCVNDRIKILPELAFSALKAIPFHVLPVHSFEHLLVKLSTAANMLILQFK